MVCERLVEMGFVVRLVLFSAVDRYLGLRMLPCVWLETDAGLADLARLFDGVGEGIRFPGTSLADAALDIDGTTFYFRCLDTDAPSPPRFCYDWGNSRFLDPNGVYPLLRTVRENLEEERIAAKGKPKPAKESRGETSFHGSTRLPPQSAKQIMPTPALFFGKLDALETALALSRYPLWNPDSRTLPIQPDFTGIASIEQQRTFLSCMLLSPRPDCGLEYLKASGLIAKLWPEIASLDDVEHSKDFHPEGNGWKHTLAMFQYRKRNGPRYNGNAQSKGLEHNGNTHGVTGDNTHNTAAQNNDLILSLGLLLHDTGKPLSSSAGSHRFEQHAELGATVARRFLDRLGFAPDVADSVCFLVRNHMFPAALPRLPLANYQKIVGSPLFPVLMELYRCDESSSFKGLDRYYEASAAYQAYLRKKRQ